ncbi:hypothetical protein EDD85DRAFT_792873 [Armillaria nabsnona]|nr:hypothetical protein EDD85DRAFT_792873 [Armillaria nabsnona]
MCMTTIRVDEDWSGMAGFGPTICSILTTLPKPFILQEDASSSNDAWDTTVRIDSDLDNHGHPANIKAIAVSARSTECWVWASTFWHPQSLMCIKGFTFAQARYDTEKVVTVTGVNQHRIPISNATVQRWAYLLAPHKIMAGMEQVRTALLLQLCKRAELGFITERAWRLGKKTSNDCRFSPLRDGYNDIPKFFETSSNAAFLHKNLVPFFHDNTFSIDVDMMDELEVNLVGSNDTVKLALMMDLRWQTVVGQSIWENVLEMRMAVSYVPSDDSDEEKADQADR